MRVGLKLYFAYGVICQVFIKLHQKYLPCYQEATWKGARVSLKVASH